eukprot:gene57861-biopygen59290
MAGTTLFALCKMGGEDAANGTMLVFIYSYEIKAPPEERHLNNGKKSRKTQLYSKATQCMREIGDPSMNAKLTDRERDLQKPRVADDYGLDTLIPWPAHSSTSTSRKVSWSFMKGNAGTFFVILADVVYNISVFSWLPGEDEWLMPTQTILKVASKVSPSLLQMLNTTHDICCMYQVNTRGFEEPSPDDVVQTRLLVLQQSASIFEQFLRVYSKEL